MIERLFADAPTKPERELWLWQLLFRPIRVFVLAFARFELRGRDNIPATGPYIVVANHINWKDPPVVSLALGISIRWMAKAEAFRWPVLGFLMRGAGNIALRRGESDRRALQIALDVLAHDLPLGVFPEGTRSRDGAVQRARPGISLIAERTNAPIVPCAVTGTPTARLRPIRRTEAVITFGAPFRFSDLPDDVRRDRQAAADAIMSRVAALLPADRRGVYADTATTGS